MKRKLFRSYYSKLTLTCLVAVFCTVSFVAALMIHSLYADRVVSTIEDYDTVIKRMAQSYDEIWDDYYMIFKPIYDDANAGNFRKFCSGESTGYAQTELIQSMERMFQEICMQDSRIAGIYFRRCSDDMRYMYLRDKKKLSKVSLELEGTGIYELPRRTLIGGQRISWEMLRGMGVTEPETSGKNLNVYGILSRVLSAEVVSGVSDYQLAALYQLDSFDDMISKYGSDVEARFLITSQQGLIFYDSEGKYDYNKAAYYEKIEKITGTEDRFTEDGVTYRKKSVSTKNGNCLVFYIVPESTVTEFRFNGMAGVVILAAVAINIVLILVMLSVNQLVGRKFHELERGLRQIGKNNLSYRVPVGRNQDEFDEIAVFFNNMCDDLEETINKNYVYQVLQRNAEYKALQTSVNPHFLYNSLEAVREKLDESGQGDESEMILMLSRIFEYQIRGESIVSIKQELDSLQNYIDFSSIRYQYAFEYFIDFEDELLDYKVPKQILQPVMENYFAHGFRGDQKDRIYIQGYLDSEDDMIHICFCDNGKGMSEEQIEALLAFLDKSDDSNSHMGLCNVHNRLKIAFSRESHVEITSNAPESGVNISLVFGKQLRIGERDSVIPKESS